MAPTPQEEAEAAKALADAGKGAADKADAKTAGSSELLPLAVSVAQSGRPRGPLVWPQLTKTNYPIWVIKMRVAMQSARIWEAVERTTADYEVDREALYAIYQSVPDSFMPSLAGKDSAKAAWETIRAAHVGHDRVQQASLQAMRLEFEQLKMGDAEAVDDFAARLNTLVAKLRTLGDMVTELRSVQKFLQAAPARYMQIVTSIEQCVPLNTLSVEDLIGRYKAYDERVRMRFGDPQEGEHLMFSRSQWQKYEEKKKGGDRASSSSRKNSEQGKPKTEGQSSDSQKSDWKFDIRKVKCHNCGRKGHFKRDCTQPKKQRALLAQQDGGDDGPALLMMQTCSLSHGEEKHQSEVFLIEDKVQLQVCNENRETGSWYLDTGASNHMCGCEEKFSEIDPSVTGRVKFGDGSTVKIHGLGTVLFQCKNGEHRALTNVYFIPALKSNIISIGQLSERGCKMIIEDDYLQIFDTERKLLANVKRTRNRLYILDLIMAKPVCLKASTGDEAWKWHARYGHLNFKALRELARKGMVKGLPCIDHVDQICDGCLISKQRRASFPKATSYRAKKPLVLVHGDLCGPISPATPAGKRYFLLLVDDHSRYMWVVLLKTKDQALDAFKLVKNQAEKQAESSLKSLRTDRGGEFNSKEFKAYCGENGIIHYMTAPYSPQQNGVVERRNQTVVSMARSLLKSKNVPGKFWGEAVATAVYLLNRAPTKSLTNITPYEAWKNKKPSVQHLRTFGSVAYAKVTKPHLPKLADRSVKTVMLGYETNAKAYRLYDPVNKQLLVSRDVIFDENAQWDWSSMQQQEDESSDAEFAVFYPEDENTETREFSEVPKQGEEVHGDADLGSPHTPAAQTTSGEDTFSTPLAAPARGVGSVDGDETGAAASASAGPQGYRNLQELLDQTEPYELIDSDLCMLSAEEPSNLVEARKEACWCRAMDEEINSIVENETWIMVDPPKDQKPIGLKWVYKIKKDPSGAIVKHKARLVAKGYVQRQGIDYEEVYAPVARLETVRLLVALAAQEEWQVHHMDVKSAFLNGELCEDVYVIQPPGYEKEGQEHRVLKLKKALYGLKQAPRAWNIKLDESLLSLGFARCPLEHGVYVKCSRGARLIVGVYVDDLIITGSSRDEIAKFKDQMMELFKMSDLGLLSYYLGIEVAQTTEGITICQASYAEKILDKAGMSECNPSQVPMEPKIKLRKSTKDQKVDSTYFRSLVGSLRYLVNTRPDLAFSVGIVSRFMEEPTVHHMNAIRQILRYLRGTINYGCHYRKGVEGEPRLLGYSDSDLAGDIEDRKSTSGTVFFLGSNLVTWASQKQKVVAISSCEAEYIAAATAACQAIWLSRLLAGLQEKEEQVVKLKVDNKSAISLCKNPVLHDRSKHIDIRYHFIRDCVETGKITVEHVSTGDQLADLLTKPLPRVKFIELRERIGIRSVKNREQA